MRRKAERAVTYLGATLAAVVTLYGCSAFDTSDSAAPHHPDATDHARATGDASNPSGRQTADSTAQAVLAALVVPAGTTQLPQASPPAGLRAPGQILIGTTSDRCRFYRLPVPVRSAVAFLRSHLPGGMAADDADPAMVVDAGPTVLVVRARARLTPAGLRAVELVDTIIPAGSGSSLLRADVEIISRPAQPGQPGPGPAASAFRSLHVSAAGDPGHGVTTTSASVLATVERLLRTLPAGPAADRSCPAVDLVYQLTLQPAVAGQPVVVVTASGCQRDEVSVGGREEPALRDPADSLYLLARTLLGPRMGWPLLRLPRCGGPAPARPQRDRPQLTVPCPGVPSPAPSTPV
jgi:hypothetical protein